MKEILKQLASRLPIRCQQELKRLHFGRQVRQGTFLSDENEFGMLDGWASRGAWVLDIGANVGHYVSRLSEIVGVTGRVLAFEPVPQTFEILAANVALFPLKNVTLLNVAVSETTTVLRMTIPKFDTGINNYYMATVTNEPAELSVLCLPIDSLRIPKCVKLAKIDVEGHELSVLKGMEQLLMRDHPTLIVEGDSDEVAAYLEAFGYSFEKNEGSPNRVFRHCCERQYRSS